MSHSQRFGAGSFFFFDSKGFLLQIKKEQGALPFQKVLLIPRDLDGIQTHDLQNRNLTLYSAKLQGQSMYNLPCTIYNFQQSHMELSSSLTSSHSSHIPQQQELPSEMSRICQAYHHDQGGCFRYPSHQVYV